MLENGDVERLGELATHGVVLLPDNSRGQELHSWNTDAERHFRPGIR